MNDQFVSSGCRPQLDRNLSTEEGREQCGAVRGLAPLSTLKLMADAEIQYVSDENGEPTAVLCPSHSGAKSKSERETAYLLKSETMKRRLLEAKERQEGLSIEVAIEKLEF